MIIKVCGMRSSANIREVEVLPVDWIGFIFYPPSPRYCTVPPSPLPLRQRRVGVFVNADDAFIEEHILQWHLDILQLHGDESPTRCADIREHFHLPVIKAFGIGSPADFVTTASYEGYVDYFLFDTLSANRGGSGQSFCHDWLKNYTGHTPFLLSGGIGIENIHELRTIHHPKWVGIDLNSRFETAPAVKSPALLNSFFHSLFLKMHNSHEQD